MKLYVKYSSSQFIVYLILTVKPFTIHFAEQFMSHIGLFKLNNQKLYFWIYVIVLQGFIK